MKIKILLAIPALIVVAALSFYVGFLNGEKVMQRRDSEIKIRTMTRLNEEFEKGETAAIIGDIRMSIMVALDDFDKTHNVDTVSPDFAPYLAEARIIQKKTDEDMSAWSTKQIKKILEAHDPAKTNQ